MGEFLESARGVIEKWEKAMDSVNPESLFLLNEAQCKQLWRNLRRVYDAFEPSFSYPGNIQQKCRTIFIDFYIVVVRGGTIVEMCSSKESWLRAALFYGDNQRMFQELSVDLQSCADIAHQMTQSLLICRPLSLVDNVLIRHDQADVDFRSDTTRLKTKLVEHVQQPGLQENEKSLAFYLLERENHRSSTDPHRIIQDRGSLESTIPSFFESASREYPTVGKNIARGGLEGVTVVEVEWLGLKCAKKEFLNVLSEESFAKEVNALVGLNHPNVVKLLCSRSEMPHPSFLMEFVDMSLFEFIKEMKRNHTPIQIVPAVDLMLQMALGMEYLHGQGVVHRDLKSPNILVSPSPHPGLRSLGYAAVKVTDFGLAKVEVFGPAVPTWRMRGTPYWIAPEAVDPKGRVDWRKADTYSFAVTCLEILKCEVGSESAAQHFPQECPIYLYDFLQKCRDPENPNNRPFFEEIVETLRSFKKHLLLGTAPIKQAPVKSVESRPLAYMKKIFRKLSGRGSVVLPRLDHALPSMEENELYRSTIGDIRSGLETVASLCAELNGHWLQQVKVCHIQCDHLAKEYLDGVEKLRSTFDHVSRKDMLNLFRSRKLQHFARCLGRLGTSILSAAVLLQKCGSGINFSGFPYAWPLMALKISVPPPPNGIMYSSFGRCLLELYWNLYVIHHTLHDARSEMTPQLLSTKSNLRFEWCNQRCKLILRRNTLGHAVNDEFLAQDAERQELDRKALLHSLNTSSISLPDEDKIHLSEFEAVLRKRLQSAWESANESGLARTSAPRQDYYFIEVPGSTSSSDAVDAATWFKFFDILTTSPLKCEFCFRWCGAYVLLYTDVDDHSNSEDFFRSIFLAEVEALARVQPHPGIVQFLGYAYDVEKPDVRYHMYLRSHFYLTEPSRTPLYIPARQWSRYFQGLPFPLRFTVEMLLQIAEGMMHVHQCGVLHRNLNPSNILYEHTGSPVEMQRKGFGDMEAGFCTLTVTGFEFAVTLPSRRPLNSSDKFYSDVPVGTFPFMAPEVCKSSLTGEGYTWSVDVWSFGMVASFILTGSIPEVRGRVRGGDTVQRKDWTSVLKEDKLVLLGEVREDCPVHLTELITRCCTRKPEARPSFEQIWKELWTIKKDHDMRF